MEDEVVGDPQHFVFATLGFMFNLVLSWWTGQIVYFTLLGVTQGPVVYFYVDLVKI